MTAHFLIEKDVWFNNVAVVYTR